MRFAFGFHFDVMHHVIQDISTDSDCAYDSQQSGDNSVINVHKIPLIFFGVLLVMDTLTGINARSPESRTEQRLNHPYVTIQSEYLAA